MFSYDNIPRWTNSDLFRLFAAATKNLLPLREHMKVKLWEDWKIEIYIYTDENE